MSCIVTTIDQCLRRGASDSFEILVVGQDLTADANKSVWFTAKQNKNLTTAREISRSNKDASYPLVLLKIGSDTKVTVPIIPEDTQDLQVASLVAGVEYKSDINPDDKIVVADGTLSIEFDVRTPFDNYDLPDDAVTFQQVDASDFEIDSLMKVELVNGVRTMVEYTLDDLKTDLGL